MMYRIRVLSGLVAALTLVGSGMSNAKTPADALSFGTASVTYGPYLRAEAGLAFPNFADGHWLPTGYPIDPRVDFDLSGKRSGFAAIAVGYDWMNGFRGDIALLNVGRSDVTGPHTTLGPHADITSASVDTTAIMANLFYSPLEQLGRNSRLQPFFVVGIGLANNRVGDWTRTNTATTPVTRTYSGATHSDLALSLGVGMSYQLTPPGKYPVILELAYRYYRFGTAKGGSTADKGLSVPVEPLTFRNNAGIVSVGLRIPLNHL